MAVYREMLGDDEVEGNGFIIGQEVDGSVYAGVFSTNCSVNLTNHNLSTDVPSYACANPLEYGYCCIDDSTVCSINNEYDCIAAGGVYFGDDLSADCVIGSPCEDPIAVETVNCARAGVLSYMATEADCAGGLAEQMYHYAGDIDTTTGLPVDEDTYSIDYIIGSGDFNINPVHVATDGELTQGYCLGHNRVTECSVDVNTLSPNVIAAGTLKAYCNTAKIYGLTYSCQDDSVCNGVSDYDRTIDDCFSTNTTGLCGKGLSTDFITLLNANNQSTCEQTGWPVNEYFPCGGSSCSQRIKVWPGTGVSWPTTSNDDFVSLFSCEPCLNSFCAFLMATDPQKANVWCRRAGDWTEDAAALYESYFEAVYDGECNGNNVDDLNPFCGDVEVNWENLSGSIQNFGTFSQTDVNNFKQSSVECLTQIEALSNGVVDCSGDIEGDYKDLLFANFREGVEHPNLLNRINDVPTKRTVPGALTTFTFVPVICPSEGECLAGQQDLASSIGGTNDDARYTSLIYGIDSIDDPNISLVGSTNSNIGLCYADSCDDDLPPREGSRKQRVQNTIELFRDQNNNNNQLYGLIVTNCQNRILCRDGQPCNVCGSLDDLQEEFDPPTVGCYNCANGECTTRIKCLNNETVVSSCSSISPCSTGQCCSDDDPPCNEKTLAECNAINGSWSTPDIICEDNACGCEVDAEYGHCCTSTGSGSPTYSYTCENNCGGGVWQVAETEDLNFCSDLVGCCYRIINNNTGVGVQSTDQTTFAQCPPNTDQDGDGNTIVYSRWTANDPDCTIPTGRLCNPDGTCEDKGVNTVIINSGSTGLVVDPNWTENLSCGVDECDPISRPSCCQGDITTGTLFCEDVPFGEEETFCLPIFGKNTSGSQASQGLQNTQSDKPCESVNCETQSWGSCCYKSSASAPPTCVYPTGEYYCLNTLNSVDTSTPTWSSGNDTDFCNLCGAEPLMDQCCYYTTPLGQPQEVRCTMVEVGTCNRSTLTGQCGINLDQGSHHNPFMSATDSSDSSCSECADNTCCNCNMPDATVSTFTCPESGEPSGCPTLGMTVRIILEDIVPLSGQIPDASPVFCNPDIKVILCDMDSDESQSTSCPDPFQYGLYTDSEIPNTSYCCNDVTADLGISLSRPDGLAGGIDLTNAGVEIDGSYQFFVTLTNCHSQTAIAIGDSPFSINPNCTIGPSNPIGSNNCGAVGGSQGGGGQGGGGPGGVG